ncbi:hypothetical protein DUI87_19857 [Hirundo rustica rustica]|uniref:Uncharacterized protein n=1 Tax=Hirundo rustica rustica TaxID=333673 RepID=A0A3M0JP92_HIRRU|nr:hypothetical protein DUI87_19857 [Hirundo rustica rustica]
MRGRLLARLRRRRQLRLLLALGALALGLWAAYLELVAMAGGGAVPERKQCVVERADAQGWVFEQVKLKNWGSDCPLLRGGHIVEVEIGGHPGHSDHKVIKFEISVDRRKSAGKPSALDTRRAGESSTQDRKGHAVGLGQDLRAADERGDRAHQET